MNKQTHRREGKKITLNTSAFRRTVDKQVLDVMREKERGALNRTQKSSYISYFNLDICVFGPFHSYYFSVQDIVHVIEYNYFDLAEKQQLFRLVCGVCARVCWKTGFRTTIAGNWVAGLVMYASISVTGDEAAFLCVCFFPSFVQASAAIQ